MHPVGVGRSRMDGYREHRLLEQGHGETGFPHAPTPQGHGETGSPHPSARERVWAGAARMAIAPPHQRYLRQNATVQRQDPSALTNSCGRHA